MFVRVPRGCSSDYAILNMPLLFLQDNVTFVSRRVSFDFCLRRCCLLQGCWTNIKLAQTTTQYNLNTGRLCLRQRGCHKPKAAGRHPAKRTHCPLLVSSVKFTKKREAVLEHAISACTVHQISESAIHEQQLRTRPEQNQLYINARTMKTQD